MSEGTVVDAIINCGEAELVMLYNSNAIQQPTTSANNKK
jgi:hypothetical protein